MIVTSQVIVRQKETRNISIKVDLSTIKHHASIGHDVFFIFCFLVKKKNNPQNKKNRRKLSKVTPMAEQWCVRDKDGIWFGKRGSKPVLPLMKTQGVDVC